MRLLLVQPQEFVIDGQDVLRHVLPRVLGGPRGLPHGDGVEEGGDLGGHPVPLEVVRTTAPGLGAPYAGDHTLPIVRELVSEVVVLTDRQLDAVLRLLLQ